jgi:post-segregation antitoxin (ccd killing protein)
MAKAAIKIDPQDRGAPLASTEQQERQARWRAENSSFIAAYNKVVEEERLPLEAWRMF